MLKYYVFSKDGAILLKTAIMNSSGNFTRRAVIKSSAFGLLGVSFPSILFAKEICHSTVKEFTEMDDRYPAISDKVVSEVVGKSHFNLDDVMKMVNKRPELSRATWDWGFGDWESAVGAASHVGRRDIVKFLLSKGAKPNIFTFAMLGAYETVKSMIEFYPGIQHNYGPHGISLLSHAKVGLRMKDDLTSAEVEGSETLIAYLESLGDAGGNDYLEFTDDKQKYLGDYKYGEGEQDGFSVRLNMREMLSLGKLGSFGGALLKTSENKFMYNGAPSVEITFQKMGDKIISLTVTEPDLVLVAKKI